ncbi:hypothetical protein Tco_1076777 [Tanacetum coccineum]
MWTEMELTLEQTQQGVSYEVSFDESDTYMLERFYTLAGNPVKEILLKLNLPDHRIFKDGDGDYYSEDQYAVSIKEDTAYPCLHSPKTTEDEAQYAVSRDTQYAVFNIWNEYNILEDIKRGPYSKKSPIRRIQLLGYAVSNRLPDLINRRLKNEF